ncbi:hypothetical protein M422DRAFT_23337 [Sphaerobolus stellatus SS14]|nr:hypothetical protein M422DRAFT_23337 [Sphaerobolus stellatus SS14]
MNPYPDTRRGYYEDERPPPRFPTYSGPPPAYVHDLEHRSFVANREVQRLAQDNEFLASQLMSVTRMKDDLLAAMENRLPYVTVELDGKEIVVSRQTLLESRLVQLYARFSQEFKLEPTEECPFVKRYNKATKMYYTYAPMRLSVILWKRESEEREGYRELANWEDSWRDVAYYVEKIRIIRKPFSPEENIEEPPKGAGILASVKEYMPKLW